VEECPIPDNNRVCDGGAPGKGGAGGGGDGLLSTSGPPPAGVKV